MATQKKNKLKASAAERINFLKAEIRRHNRLYYTENSPEISDGEYDALYSELKKLEEENPSLVSSDSPTRKVGGGPLPSFRSIVHKTPMLSLENTYSGDDIKTWIERNRRLVSGTRVTFVVEPKIDGIGISLTYEKGKLALAATRGDGVKGEDVTDNVKTLKSVPLVLSGNFPEYLEVRGEVYMSRGAFSALNAERARSGEALFANPRNAAAGTMKLLDPSRAAKRKLDCFLYQAGVIEPPTKIKTHSEMLEYFKTLGMRVNPNIRQFDSVDGMLEFFEEFNLKRQSLDYDADGMVIKINEMELYGVLGHTLKAPRWACAYKFPAQQASSVLESVDMQVGRTGVVTPVANLKAVKLGGVVIKRATLHNFDEVRRLGLKVGDSVWIERRGDVIPKVTGVIVSKRVGNEKDIIEPDVCPACGSPLYKDEENVRIVCTNSFCPAQLERGIAHFASRKAMDIDGLGEKVVKSLLENSMIKDVSDIYALGKKELLELPLFKEKKAAALLEGIEKSRHRPLSKFLFAMGIPFAGEKVCRVVSRHFGSLEKIMDAPESAFEEIEGLGDVRAKAIAGYLALPGTKAILVKMKKRGVLPAPDSAPVSDKLAGKTFVFTGKIPMPREKAQEIVMSLGGKASGTVSEKTDFVVAGEKSGEKYKKALKLGVAVIDFEEFMEMTKEKTK
ncbi:NAD-dependent DNA ligase LigA [bacterium]|nr:NAD-dependent DNA ligase LigA [bacterium]MBU3930072.1 NAD-dependent DNA ligase LigA [bacterium]